MLATIDVQLRYGHLCFARDCFRVPVAFDVAFSGPVISTICGSASEVVDGRLGMSTSS